MRLNKRFAKFLPALIAIATFSVSTAMAFNNHHSPQSPSGNANVTTFTPDLCGEGGPLVGDASAFFASTGLRGDSQALICETTAGGNDIPYGALRNDAYPLYQQLTFDEFGLDDDSFFSLTVTDPVTAFINSVPPVPQFFLPLAPTQPVGNHSFTRLMSTAAGAAPFFVLGPPAAGSTFRFAAIGQGPDGNTEELANCQVNSLHLATNLLVTPGNDCVTLFPF